jgi:8-oxo-dGTP pyrophosphatase MutT (NUDIX family)
MLNVLEDTPALIKQVMHGLYGQNRHDRTWGQDSIDRPGTSAVLFLLGLPDDTKAFSAEPGLILNKRSLKVKQPGDLCFPGGRISVRLDAGLAKLLYLPGSPLTRWPFWPEWKKHKPQVARRLALLFAAGLRESFEEMGLNPFNVQFLGSMPPQRLIMFRREIYPLICWIPRQKQFRTNWEVEKVVFIPLRNVLNPAYYARYRLQMNTPDQSRQDPGLDDFPCFVHAHKGESEVLWGATFRITMIFLETVFRFKPPDIESLPVVHGTLDKNYFTGNG